MLIGILLWEHMGASTENSEIEASCILFKEDNKIHSVPTNLWDYFMKHSLKFCTLIHFWFIAI